MLAQVEFRRAEGYAVCDGELELEVRSIAMPLLSRAGATVAALSIAVRADRMAMDDIKHAFLPALRKAQVRLRNQLSED